MTADDRRGGPAPVVGTEDRDARDRRLLVWLGAGLLAGGMPVHEVQEDIHEAAHGLGHPAPQVGCLPTAITVTLSAGRPATFEQVEGGVRLDQLADVCAVRASLRTGVLTPDEALDRLTRLRAQPHRYRRLGLFAGAVLSGVGIALILAPAWSAVVFAAVLAPVTGALLLLLSGAGRTMRTVFPLLAAFVVGSAAFLAAGEGWAPSPLWILVGPIAVLLPGATIVTGLSELSAGSMVAGTARLAHGTIQMMLFALGVGAAAALLRVPLDQVDTARPAELGWWAPLLGVVLVTVAISLMESVPSRLVPWLLAVVLATYVAQLAGHTLLGTRWAGAFLGAVVASLGATLVEFLRPHLPRVVAFLPSFWLLVPGSLGLISVSRLEAAPDVAVAAFMGVTLVVVAISLGVVVGASLARPLRAAARRTGLPYLLALLPLRRRRPTAT